MELGLRAAKWVQRGDLSFAQRRAVTQERERLNGTRGLNGRAQVLPRESRVLADI